MSAAGTKRTSRGCQMSAFGVMSAFDPKRTLLAQRKSRNWGAIRRSSDERKQIELWEPLARQPGALLPTR